MTESTSELIRHSEDLATVAQGELSIDSLIAQVAKVQQAMSSVMTDGEHYGVIPGTSGKPTLLKPGAEKLCLLFRLAPDYDITRRELPGGHVEYEIVCTLRHIPSGHCVGQGLGLCTTMETRYRYRKGSHACPHCGESAIIKGKEEFGGGWLCWKKKSGCGAKFGDADFSMDDLKPIENPDLADVYNTVLKIAKKRAHVDATLTATAASDIFTQDLEDMREMVAASNRPPEKTTSSEQGPSAPAEEVAECPTLSPELTADDFWKAVNDGDVDRKVAMDALRAAGGNFVNAMENIINAQ